MGFSIVVLETKLISKFRSIHSLPESINTQNQDICSCVLQSPKSLQYTNHNSYILHSHPEHGSSHHSGEPSYVAWDTHTSQNHKSLMEAISDSNNPSPAVLPIWHLQYWFHRVDGSDQSEVSVDEWWNWYGFEDNYHDKTRNEDTK